MVGQGFFDDRLQRGAGETHPLNDRIQIVSSFLGKQLAR